MAYPRSVLCSAIHNQPDTPLLFNSNTRFSYSSSAHAEWSLTEARQAAFARDAQLQWYQQQQAVIATKTAFAGQPENPTLSTTLENLGNSRLEQLDGPSMSVQYSQTWTRPSKLELREQVAGLAEQQRQLSLRQRQAEISAEVRLCLAEWAKSAANTASDLASRHTKQCASSV